jgi:hypothetical protein
VKEQPKSDAELILEDILAELKKDHKNVDFSFLSTSDQVKAYRQLAKTQAVEEKKAAKADIATPLNSPPVVENKIKTFLERQQEAGFGRNLRDMGSYSHAAQKLYEKKNT